MTEEHEPPGRAQQARGLRDPAVGIAPDRSPVFRERKVEAVASGTGCVQRRRARVGTAPRTPLGAIVRRRELARRSCRGRPDGRPGGRAARVRDPYRIRAPRRRAPRRQAAARALLSGTPQMPQTISARDDHDTAAAIDPVLGVLVPAGRGSRRRGPLASRHDTVGAEGCVGTDGRADGHGAGEDRRGRGSRRHQDPGGRSRGTGGRGPGPGYHARVGTPMTSPRRSPRAVRRAIHDAGAPGTGLVAVGIGAPGRIEPAAWSRTDRTSRG